MLVKIICGTYGHRPNPDKSRVVRKDRKSPAFELEDAEAERIIALGVAKACSPEEMLKAKDREFPQMTKEEITSLDFNDMRKLEKKIGLDAKGTKEELTCRLKEALLGENATTEEMESDEEDEDIFVDDDNEMPPELEAQDPV